VDQTKENTSLTPRRFLLVETSDFPPTVGAEKRVRDPADDDAIDQPPQGGLGR
jgi:BRCT domain type II-containing protein